MNPYTSDPLSVHPHSSGWVELPSGPRITRLPLWDDTEKILARLGHGHAVSHLSRFGYRLPTVNELDELHRLSLFVPPVTMPTKEQLRDANIPAQVGPVNVFRASNMRSLDWCVQHDAQVFALLDKAGYQGTDVVSNAGKHWASGGIIYGWWRSTEVSDRIQNASAAHRSEPHYTDYATTTHAVHDRVTSATWADGLNLVEISIGLRALAWAGFQSQLGIREISGAKHNPQILTYSRYCRRGGKLLGVDKWGQPIWQGGNPLPLNRDEDPWCAAFASESLRCSLLPGERPPHGLRVSVRELAQDASSTGSLVSKQSKPKPGWLALYGRSGENPLRGGRGHVRMVVQLLSEGKKYLGIGGNERDQIGRDVHDIGQEVAWIAR